MSFTLAFTVSISEDLGEFEDERALVRDLQEGDAWW